MTHSRRRTNSESRGPQACVTVAWTKVYSTGPVQFSTIRERANTDSVNTTSGRGGEILPVCYALRMLRTDTSQGKAHFWKTEASAAEKPTVRDFFV